MSTTNTEPTQTPNLAHEVKKSFVNQFAENQNHHQSLFIQFLSVVIVSLLAYGYIYINTASYIPDQKETITKSSLTNQTDTSYLPPVDSKTFETIKDKEGRIISYSKVHLIGAYLFAQLVLVILALTLLHMGYSYRRDQQAVHVIRKDSLGEAEFKRIFPIGFTGLGKRFINYLPNFYAILFLAIFFIQFIIYWSTYLFFNRYPDTITRDHVEVLTIFLPDVFLYYDLSYRTLKLLLWIPFAVTLFFYFIYFVKYNTRVNNIKLITQLTITKQSDRANIQLLRYVCLGFFLVKIGLLLFLNEFSMALVASAIISFFTFIAHLWTPKIRSTEKGINISNGIVYLLASIGIFSWTVYSVYTHKFHVSQYPFRLLVISVAIAFVLYLLTMLVQKKWIKEGSNKIFVMHQFRQESYFFVILAFFYGLVVFSKVVFLDYIVAAIFGTLAFIWSVRSITYLFDSEMGRNIVENPPVSEVKPS